MSSIESAAIAGSFAQTAVQQGQAARPREAIYNAAGRGAAGSGRRRVARIQAIEDAYQPSAHRLAIHEEPRSPADGFSGGAPEGSAAANSRSSIDIRV